MAAALSARCSTAVRNELPIPLAKDAKAKTEAAQQKNAEALDPQAAKPAPAKKKNDAES